MKDHWLSLTVGLTLVTLLLAFLASVRPNSGLSWNQAWQPYGLVAEPQSKPSVDLELGDATAVQSYLMAHLGQGVMDVGFEIAHPLFMHGQGMLFWIDAREERLYNHGHIPGAHLLDFYDQSRYLEDIQQKIAEAQPIALVVYCKGVDCHDSHLLAESLMAYGHDTIFVYKGGWAEWYEEKSLPIEGTLATVPLDSPDSPASSVARQAPVPGMYAEHVLRDMIPFAFGLLLLGWWRRSERSPLLLLSSGMILGLFFVFAAIPKIAAPFAFAKAIWNYDLVPGPLVNLGGFLMPWFELVFALSVLAGLFLKRRSLACLKAGSLVMALLLVLFIAAVGWNLARGHVFDCGCTGNLVFFPHWFWAGWDDKITLICRDLGLLAMAVRLWSLREGPRDLMARVSSPG